MPGDAAIPCSFRSRLELLEDAIREFLSEALFDQLHKLAGGSHFVVALGANGQTRAARRREQQYAQDGLSVGERAGVFPDKMYGAFVLSCATHKPGGGSSVKPETVGDGNGPLDHLLCDSSIRALDSAATRSAAQRLRKCVFSLGGFGS